MVRNLISDRLLGLAYRDWQTEVYSADTAAKAKAKVAIKTISSTRKPGTTTSHPLKEYAGIYTAAGKERYELAMENDSLFMLVPNAKLYLRHHHYDVFDLWDKDDIAGNDTTNINGLKMMFRMDERGDIVSASLPLEGPAKPIVFMKSAKAAPLSKDSLQKYTGDYSLSGLVVKVYVKNENTLYVFVPGQPEYELVPVDKDKFNLKVLSGYSVLFSGNTKGEIADLTFIQPNGSFKATKVLKL